MTIEGGKSRKEAETAARQEKTAVKEAAAESGKGAGEKRYTVADIEALPEGERAELIDGEMFVMDAPTLTHQEILMWLSVKIWNYIELLSGKDRKREFLLHSPIIYCIL